MTQTQHTDPLYSDEGVAILTEDDFRKYVVAGAGIRIITPGGDVYEGHVNFPTMGYARSFVIDGVTVYAAQHTLYAIAPERVVTRKIAPIELTIDRVLRYVTELERKRPSAGGKIHAVNAKDIAYEALGFDPTIYSRSAGRSDTPLWNAWIKMSSIQRSLDKLTADGALRKVTSGKAYEPSEDDAIVVFSGRVGYVTSAAYEHAAAAVAVEARVARITELRKLAAADIAARHQDEVEQRLAELIAEEGI